MRVLLSIFLLFLALIFGSAAFQLFNSSLKTISEPSAAPPSLQTAIRHPPPGDGRRPYLELNDAHAVDNYLSRLKTKDGRSLRAILRSYGLKLGYVMAIPMESYSLPHRSYDVRGDRNVSISIERQTRRKLPCDTSKLFDGDERWIGTIVERGDTFIDDPGQTDPLLYWAMTGKCYIER